MWKILSNLILISLVFTFSMKVGAQRKDLNMDLNEKRQNIILNAKQNKFIIKLKSNPSTGYSWFLREYNSNLIIPVQHSVPSEEKKLLGGQITEYWQFQLKPQAFLVPQETKITMIYARPFQNDENVTQIIFRIFTHS